MIYCVSDIHGRLDLLEKLLDEISLSQNDKLYVLGDTIDRGGGLAALRRIMELQEAGLAKLIRGNHEENFLRNIIMFDPNVTAALRENHRMIQCYDLFGDNILAKLGQISNNLEYAKNMTKSQLSCEAAVNLTAYSGYRTVKEYLVLSDYEQKKILNFIANAPTYADVEVGGKKFLLTHAGLNQKGKVDLNVRQEFYLNRSPLKGVTTIFGHTSVRDIGIMRGTYSMPKIWFDKRYDDKIGIDCGAPFCGGRLACLRLDDMKEFYVDNEQDLAAYLGDLNDFSRTYSLPVNLDYAYIPVFEEVEVIIKEILA